ncbi:MAG TPA: MBL fold metallo-hydrolase [Ktedonobacterales bacterium]|nr:MBL fold metallo-hydrolase [Ktedonobacterales bacterium]
MADRVTLLPVDSADVTIVVDNYSDTLLPSTEVAHRAPLVWNWSEREPLRAEHGYSLLLTVERAGQRASLLYDAGLGQDTALHNLDVLGVHVADLRAIVLSHGHADHHGGLIGMVRRLSRRGLPLLLHPDVWRERKVVFPNGDELHMPPPSHNDLDREGVDIIEERGPSLLLDDTVLVTGQVDRTTPFEKGFPLQQMQTEEGWQPDTWIWDDQAIVCHVKDKGLVVLSSCSHSGAINVLLHARRLTGVDTIYAFIGGLHLTGAIMAPVIPPTLDALAEIAPTLITPGHCTGWQATHEVARRFASAYIQSSVGTRLHLT